MTRDCLRTGLIIDMHRVKSYEGMASTGSVSITGMSDTAMRALQGKHVLVVEDIVDTGLTMNKLMQYMQQHIQPKSIKVLTLLEKRIDGKESLFQADYVGFSVPNE